MPSAVQLGTWRPELGRSGCPSAHLAGPGAQATEGPPPEDGLGEGGRPSPVLLQRLSPQSSRNQPSGESQGQAEGTGDGETEAQPEPALPGHQAQAWALLAALEVLWERPGWAKEPLRAQPRGDPRPSTPDGGPATAAPAGAGTHSGLGICPTGCSRTWTHSAWGGDASHPRSHRYRTSRASASQDAPQRASPWAPRCPRGHQGWRPRATACPHPAGPVPLCRRPGPSSILPHRSRPRATSRAARTGPPTLEAAAGRARGGLSTTGPPAVCLGGPLFRLAGAPRAGQAWTLDLTCPPTGEPS